MADSTGIRIEDHDPGHPDALALLDALSEALAALTGASGRASFDPNDARGPGAGFLLARSIDGRPLGCVAWRPLGPGVAEMKRMYARPGTRGVGAALLAAVEARAGADGYGALWLETRRINTRATAFYERFGYAPIPAFGKYVGRSDAICLGKTLSASPPGPSHPFANG